jgi:photosystem II stability/assembly factor-like uncharacterized protein
MIEGVPDRPDVFYFGAAGGGIWRSDDAGRTWNSVFDRGGSSAIGAIAVAPSDPDTIYAGGGQPEPRYDVESGRGVYRSTDGGRTWSDLGLAGTRYIGRIWVSPRDRDIVLVGAVGHFFGPSASRGVYRSTDGGKTWAHTLAVGDQVGVADLAADPARPDTIFAAAWQARQWPWQSYFTRIAGPGSAIYRSDDGGVSWRRLSGGGWPAGPLGRISLATARAAGSLRVYAVVDADKDGGLWRSDDGGTHWQHVNDEKAIASYYASRITADPQDPDVVYTVGQSMRRCDRGGARCEIFRGSPGGDDYHQIWLNPRHPERIAAASDQGAAVTINGGATWSDWYNQPTGQFYHLAADNRFPYWVYSGQQDSGTVAIASRSDYGALGLRDWHPVGGDERDYDIPDPTDPDIVYGSGLGGHVSRWDARTGQVSDISPWPVSSYGLRPTIVKHHYNWVTPLVSSRTGPPALYLGGEIVFRSRDQGRTWAQISPDLTGKRIGAQRCDGDVAIADAKACGYGTITALEPSPRAADEIWVGTDSGVVQVTRDGGGHWTEVTPPAVREWAKVSSIDLSRLDGRTAYIAIDGQRLDDFSPRIFRTHDGGASWTAVANGLPPGQVVSAVRADPEKAGLLYAGTETGVFVSFDDGDDWQKLQLNLPTAWARDLLVHGDDLVVATQGRGIWVLGDLALLRQLTPAPSARTHLFAPAAAFRVRGDNDKDTPLAPETPVGENPPEGAVIDYWLGARPKSPVVLEIRDSRGALVRLFASDDRPEPVEAERYFAAAWTRAAPALPATPGHHRWVWNLRRERPKAVEYSYGIAAVWGRPTPILPQGALVVPGDYLLSLKVDGSERKAILHVGPDPRVAGAGYQASADFSEALREPMAKAWRGYAEADSVREGLARAAPGVKDPVLRGDLRAFAEKLADLAGDNGFKRDSSVLAGIETAVEDSDSAPTAAMLGLFSETRAKLARDLAAWDGLRSRDLAALNARLARAGVMRVAVPQPRDLHVRAPEGGQDLP